MTIANSSSIETPTPTYDRAKEVKEFDDSKIGVKGLIDSGITSIPRIFIHPPESLPTPNPTTTPNSTQIPTINLSDPRPIIISQIHQASRTLGFFQIINHPIPKPTLHRMIQSIKSFNELPAQIKSQYYNRDLGRGVSFSTNFDLFSSKAASWRDTLQVKLGPTPLNTDFLPEICRQEIIEWDKEILRLGETLMGLLSEALGLPESRLKDLSFLGSRLMVGHYYPYCPQPDLTVGITPHMDPGVLTILLQDQIGGLQVKYGEEWVDVKPLDGALVINVGDVLEMVTNGEYKSVEHRVLANPNQQPRISVGLFFNPGDRERVYGPLDELISEEKPAIYRGFTLTEFLEKLFRRGLDGKTLLDQFRVGLRRGGLAAHNNGPPRNFGVNGGATAVRQRGFVRPADRYEDQPTPKIRLSSAIVKVKEDGELTEDVPDGVQDVKEKESTPKSDANGNDITVDNDRKPSYLPQHQQHQRGGFSRRDGGRRSNCFFGFIRKTFKKPTEEELENKLKLTLKTKNGGVA